MLSKEWKLIALAIFAMSCLTACPNPKKKKNHVNPYQGLWINEDAARLAENIGPMADASDYHICSVVSQRPGNFGISRSWDGSVSLDAWNIGQGGDVWIYTTTPSSSANYQQNFYMGQVAGDGSFSRAKDQRFAYNAYDNQPGSPLRRGRVAHLFLEGQVMIVSSERGHATSYVRTTPDRLNRLNARLSLCGQRLTLGGVPFQNPQHQPYVQPTPEAVPGDGRFPHVGPRPDGPQVPPYGASAYRK